MIHTVTLNPSLDYLVFLPKAPFREINRTEGEIIFPGGKGINVALVLQALGFKCQATGFYAGYTGLALLAMLENKISKLDFIKLAGGQTRINVKVKYLKEMDINGKGPKVSAADFKKLLSKLSALKDGDTLILSGSVANGLKADTYYQILNKLKNKKILTVVDATNDLLKNSLKLKPFLIKPNLAELSALFGVRIKTQKDLIKYAKKTQELGARNVLISLGAKGALLLTESGEVLQSAAVRLNKKVVNSVGAGDSMVAGFIAAWLKTKCYKTALELAVACGGACVTGENLPSKKDILALAPKAKGFLSK